MNQHIELIKKIATHLLASKWQLVTAESCTGGLIASAVTEIAGSSQWFERGFVTYSNLAKEEMLSVSPQLIRAHGAVSEEVALAMALGALQHSTGHIAVSVTGIAGPDGGSIEKPVGTVCFGWATRATPPRSLKKQFDGSRQDIRLAACREALEGVLSIVTDK